MAEFEPGDLLPDSKSEIEMDLKQIFELSDSMIQRSWDLGFIVMIRTAAKRGLKALDSIKNE